jgi:hypothetical protein
MIAWAGAWFEKGRSDGHRISFRGDEFDDSGQVIEIAVGGDEVREPVPALACLQVLVDLPG